MTKLPLDPHDPIDHLKLELQRREETVTDLALAIEESESTLHSLLNRESTLGPELAEKLSRHFGVPVEQWGQAQQD